MTQSQEPDAPGHSVIRQRPLTQMEQKAVPVDDATAAESYINPETGEVFQPAADWKPWRWFGIMMRVLCFFRRDAPGHPGSVLRSLLAGIGRWRGRHAAPVTAAARDSIAG